MVALRFKYAPSFESFVAPALPTFGTFPYGSAGLGPAPCEASFAFVSGALFPTRFGALMGGVP
jgi:hypothetical protein